MHFNKFVFIGYKKRILEKGFFFFGTLCIILSKAVVRRIGMKLLNCMMVGTFFSFSCLAFFEPEKGLRSPGEVVQEIKELLEVKEIGDGSVVEKKYLKRLLCDALYADHLCGRSLESDAALLAWFEKSSGPFPTKANDLKDFIGRCQKAGCSDSESLALLYNDFQVIMVDCMYNCQEYREELKEQIPLVYELYMGVHRRGERR